MGWRPWYQERKQARLNIENHYGEDGFHEDDDFHEEDGFHEEDDAGDDDCIGMSGPVMSGWCS